MKSIKWQIGFTMIELLVTISIIGIIAGLITPSYQKYLKKARYVEVIQATLPLKLAVEECYQLTGNLSECQLGKNGILSSSSSPGIIDNINITGGIITITPKERYGIRAKDTYVLTPLIVNEYLTWGKSGGAVENGLAN